MKSPKNYFPVGYTFVFAVAVVIGGAMFFGWALIWIAMHLDLQTLRRWFYAIVIPAIFFYVMRAVRAVALYYEAKAETWKAESRNGGAR